MYMTYACKAHATGICWTKAAFQYGGEPQLKQAIAKGEAFVATHKGIPMVFSPSVGYGNL